MEEFEFTLEQSNKTTGKLTLPETNSSHLPGSPLKRKVVFQASIFGCKLIRSLEV